MISIFSRIGCPWLYQRPMNLILLFESIEVFKYVIFGLLVILGYLGVLVLLEKDLALAYIKLLL